MSTGAERAMVISSVAVLWNTPSTSWLWSSMNIIPPRSTSFRMLPRSAAEKRTGRWPVIYTSGYSRIASDASGTFTPLGAIEMLVYCATESMRFAGTSGAESQSPESYWPVQNTNRVTADDPTRLPTAAKDPRHAVRQAAHDVPEPAQTWHPYRLATHRQPRPATLRTRNSPRWTVHEGG